MNRNILYVAIGALAVAGAVLGYRVYEERREATGIQITVGKSGVSIEKN